MRGRCTDDKKIDVILAELDLGDDDGARAVLHAIASYPAPVPTVEQSKALAQAARGAKEARAATAAQTAQSVVAVAPARRVSMGIIMGQLHIIGPRGLVLGVALFAAAFLAACVASGGLLAASAAVPICAGLFLVYALRAGYYGVSEIEGVCPVGPAQLALARVLIASAVDTGVGLVAAAAVSIIGGQPFGLVLLSWLGPAVLLTGVALYASLEWGPATAVAVMSAIGALGLLPTGLHGGVSPFAPVGAQEWLEWKLTYVACGLVLIGITLLRLKRLEEGGWPGAAGS
ncbi:MAG: hypothetical protein VB144_05610 [Clostridia bacterium]|nr:hypothetical protein [Clostridia bacterium]